GTPYSPPGQAYQDPPPSPDNPSRGYYSQNEIVTAGQGFFGAVSKGLASAIEYTYSSVGRPNGYILGEDGGGAYFAGLRYGEGKLFTK
ncbi:EipA family protein, partial [Acinetobacter baumannii]